MSNNIILEAGVYMYMYWGYCTAY